jgi:hypothetical protein
MGLGFGSNNYAKLISLKLLYCLAKEKYINSLQIFGDSMNDVNVGRLVVVIDVNSRHWLLDPIVDRSR